MENTGSQLEEGQQGFIVQAVNLELLFTTAATTLFSHLVEKTTTRGLKVLDERTVEVAAATPTELLVNWLNVLLSLFNRYGMVGTECEVIEMDERHLEAVVAGEEYTPRCHQLKRLIKRVLAHQSRVRKTGGLWQAAVVYEPEAPLQVSPRLEPDHSTPHSRDEEFNILRGRGSHLREAA